MHNPESIKTSCFSSICKFNGGKKFKCHFKSKKYTKPSFKNDVEAGGLFAMPAETLVLHPNQITFTFKQN